MIRQTMKCFSFLATGFILLASQVWAQQGDPLRGEALFVGTVRFAQGGAPCLACHGISGRNLGYAGGASYGPDLTGLYDNYGEDGIAGVLEDLSFESMVAIYSSRPLTEDERADLLAFFSQLASNGPVQITPSLVLHTAVTTAFFLGIIGLLGWRRLQGVRKPLVESARYGKGESA